MAESICVLALVVAVTGALLPLLPPFVPRLGPGLFHRLPLRQQLLGGSAGLAALLAALSQPSTSLWVLFTFTLFFAVHAQLYPQRLLVALDAPPHVAAERAGIGDDALVLGAVIDGTACAWMLEMLVPRHLVNDRVGSQAVLAAY